MGKRLHTPTKHKVWARDKNICFYCRIVCIEEPNLPNSRTVDHRDPSFRGLMDNLVTACKYCNNKKGNMRPQETGTCIKFRAFEAKRLGLV